MSCNSKVNDPIDLEVYNFEGIAPYLNLEGSKTYVVNFWATWCAPCVKELPHFESLQSKYIDSVEVILVSLDFPHQYETKLKPFIQNIVDELVNLEKETLNNQNEFKSFYSKLTLIAKEYLENDIKISASESTTTQLIDKIILLNDSKKINISVDIIESFKSVLNNADLVKSILGVFEKQVRIDQLEKDREMTMKNFKNFK